MISVRNVARSLRQGLNDITQGRKRLIDGKCLSCTFFGDTSLWRLLWTCEIDEWDFTDGSDWGTHVGGVDNDWEDEMGTTGLRVHVCFTYLTWGKAFFEYIDSFLRVCDFNFIDTLDDNHFGGRLFNFKLVILTTRRLQQVSKLSQIKLNHIAL